MRRSVILIALVALVAACGGAGTGPPTTAEPAGSATTETSEPGVTTPPTSAATTVAPTTTVPSQREFTVAVYGHFPDVSLTSSDALGSGCAPGTDTLPDGIWFGWISESDDNAIEFDLACLWPGSTQPAASNDSSKLRTVRVSADVVVYNATDQPIPYDVWGGDLRTTNNNAPGLPGTIPFLVFVNDGAATEIVEYPVPIYWALRSSAWPAGLEPGCCAMGDIAPPSPEGPWPDEGWPADGFYDALVLGRSRSSMEIQVDKWLSCAENPELCPDDWTDENVIVDRDAESLLRLLTFDRDETYILMPIDSDVPLVGNGIVFRELLDEMDLAVETWIVNPDTSVSWDEMARLAAEDPSFPFGNPEGYPDDQHPIGFRGPGGTVLVYPPPGDQDHLGWTALEIAGGDVFFYIHMGLIAG